MADNQIEKLSSLFLRFPGIGQRQAKRFVYFLLNQDERSLENLSNTIRNLKKETSQCQQCFRFFTNFGDKQTKKCTVCLDQNRDQNLLMILEKDTDLEAVLKANIYQGQFFILGGLIPILDKNPESRIRLKELKSYLANHKPTEIVLALSANNEGDNTILFLKQELIPLLENKNIKISTLGRGLSTGTELEYSDTETIIHALNNRQVKDI